MTLARRVQALHEWWPRDDGGGEQSVVTLWRWRMGERLTGWYREGGHALPHYRREGERLERRSVRFRRG